MLGLAHDLEVQGLMVGGRKKIDDAEKPVGKRLLFIAFH